jgi:hypothetical protein
MNCNCYGCFKVVVQRWVPIEHLFNGIQRLPMFSTDLQRDKPHPDSSYIPHVSKKVIKISIFEINGSKGLVFLTRISCFSY